jgi:hypothetical protein
MNWTTEQILKLAPDASSAKAGHGLLNLNKWSGLGTDERAAWGLCQGRAILTAAASRTGIRRETATSCRRTTGISCGRRTSTTAPTPRNRELGGVPGR